jgi:phage tail-like protein
LGAGDPPAAQPSPDLIGHGAFAECEGLELEADLKELLEGGANDAVVRRAGRVKLVPIVLKRGMLVVGPGAGSTAGPPTPGSGSAETALWDWLQGMVAGTLPVPRYDGSVEVRDPADRRVVARWVFTRGLPQKVSGPRFDAKSGEIAMESLTIAHEGLRMEVVA